MRYWFDTEFIERGPNYPIELLSIGIVAEDGREFYAEANWTPLSHASQWVWDNVVPYLDRDDHSRHNHEGCPLMSRTDMAQAIQDFCNPDTHGKPEFWAYYADYDWVVLCQLFGTMMDLPKGWPMYCRDIKQQADEAEVVMQQMDNSSYKLVLPEQGKGEHHALADARWNQQAWKYIKGLEWL